MSNQTHMYTFYSLLIKKHFLLRTNINTTILTQLTTCKHNDEQLFSLVFYITHQVNSQNGWDSDRVLYNFSRPVGGLPAPKSVDQN